MRKISEEIEQIRQTAITQVSHNAYRCPRINLMSTKKFQNNSMHADNLDDKSVIKIKIE